MVHRGEAGVRGYVLADRVKQLQPAHEGIELPEAYQPLPDFKAVYSATADVNLSIRKEKDENAKLLGTVYENESVDVMDFDEKWAHVKKDNAEGYVLRSHLRYFRRYDPYGPYVPGVVFYPYAAMATETTEIVNSETGESLRDVPKGVVMAVSAMQDDLSVTLPYDRITGRIRATGNLELEVVHAWDEARVGDLVAVFSTYYDPEQSNQTQIGRLHNIMQGVERLNNVIVPSGEKFYFNDYCAPYTKSNGYELGPIVNYVSSKKLGYGGGICQVSTTLYNAILQIPISVIKTQVHSSYGISYVPLDMDAAVGAGNLDLRLQNTLPYDVRFALQAVGGVLTVRVYRAS
ncbi:MAG: VanW family protein [Christensenellales bacterium]